MCGYTDQNLVIIETVPPLFRINLKKKSCTLSNNLIFQLSFNFTFVDKTFTKIEMNEIDRSVL